MDLTSWLKRVVFYRMDITFSQAFAYWNEIARDYTIKNREAVWTSQFSTCRGAPPQKRYGPLPANPYPTGKPNTSIFVGNVLSNRNVADYSRHHEYKVGELK